MNNFPSNLKYLRKKKGLLQDEMQLKLGISRTTWSNYENGITNPSVDDLIRFSKFFGVTLDELIIENLTDNNSTPKKKNSKPVPYKLNDIVTLSSEPEFIQLQQDMKKLKEEMNAIKKRKKK